MSLTVPENSDDNFLKDLSEEINTPLKHIVENIEFLQLSDLNDEQKKWIRSINISISSLSSTLYNLMDTSEENLSNLKFENKDFNLKQIIHHVVSEFSFKIGDKDIDLDYDIEKDLKFLLKGDPGRLRELISILLSKVISITKKGEVSLNVVKEEDSETELKLKVCVSGANKNLEGTQVEQMIKGGVHNITFINKLLSYMSGELGFHFGEDGSFDVWFSAPFRIQLSLKKKKSKFLANLKDMDVLLIDNSAIRREFLKKHLRVWGCNYEEAANQDAAIQKLNDKQAKGSKFHFILVQHTDAGINGFECANMIKPSIDSNTTPLVMLTSQGKRGDAQVALDAGYSAYITSPVSESQLFSCFLNIVNLDDLSEDKTLITKYDV